MISAFRELRRLLFSDNSFGGEEQSTPISLEAKQEIATYIAELYREIYPNMSKPAYESIRELVFSVSDATLGTKSTELLFSTAALRKLAAQIIRSNAAYDKRHDFGPLPQYRGTHKDAGFNDEVALLKEGLNARAPVSYSDQEARLMVQLKGLEAVRASVAPLRPTREDFIEASTQWLTDASKVAGARSR